MINTVIRKPGEAIDFETVFVENTELLPDFTKLAEHAPEAFKEKLKPLIDKYPASGNIPEKVGRFERFDYKTAVYEDGVTYDKYANVYLPWCYDPADKERKYNIVYFQHGNTGDPEGFTSPHMKLLLDRLFYTEGVDPCIMVFTTYYFDVTKDVEVRRTTGNVPAGDEGWDGCKHNFWMEVLLDLIPAVETRYNTYLTGTSEAELKANRDHRAFSGYSRGCAFTWSMVHHALEYFRYYIPMSCISTAGHNIFRDKFTNEEVVDYLTSSMKAHPELPFFIYAFNGGTMDIAFMADQMNALIKAPEIHFSSDQTQGNFYYCESGYNHGDPYAVTYYYNALPKIW